QRLRLHGQRLAAAAWSDQRASPRDRKAERRLGRYGCEGMMRRLYGTLMVAFMVLVPTAATALPEGPAPSTSEAPSQTPRAGPTAARPGSGHHARAGRRSGAGAEPHSRPAAGAEAGRHPHRTSGPGRKGRRRHLEAEADPAEA